MLTVVIGALFTALAILGFEKLSRFAQVCSPWIFLVFIAGAVAVLPDWEFAPIWETLGNRDDQNLERDPRCRPGQIRLLARDVFRLVLQPGDAYRLSDMAIFRYAKKWTYGLYTAFGMYPGHMLAWICSGIMVAAVGREMNPGLMAFEAAGLAGVAGCPLRRLDDGQSDALPGRIGASDDHSRLAPLESDACGRGHDHGPGLLSRFLCQAAGLCGDLRPRADADRRRRLRRTLDFPLLKIEQYRRKKSL